MAPNESHGQARNSVTLGTPVPDSDNPFSNSPDHISEKGLGYSKLAPHTKPGTTTKAPPKPKPTNDPLVGDRQWTDYEMQTVLALICKGYHLKKGGALTFATALNEALNGKRREHMDDDVEVEDVALLLEWLEREKKGAL